MISKDMKITQLTVYRKTEMMIPTSRTKDIENKMSALSSCLPNING